MNTAVTASGALVLLAAVAFQFVLAPAAPPPAREPHLATTVPAEVVGWQSREMPLGSTESVSSAAEQILNYDDYFYREYRRDDTRVAVFVTYWGPGKMPVRLVASHTPDRCWTENGWECLETRHRESWSAGEVALQPAEGRVFMVQGFHQHVAYWHLIDGKVAEEGARFNAIPDPVTWLRDYFKNLGSSPEEQYFIRVNSNVPLAEFWNDAGFQQVVAGLARLGLAAGAAPVEASQ